MPLAMVETRLARPAAIDLGQVALVAYLGAGCSALTYTLWGYALRHIEAGRAAMFDALIPVVGVAAAAIVLQEAPLVWHLVGGTCIVAAVWMTVCESRPTVAVAPSAATAAGYGMKRRGCVHGDELRRAVP